MSKTKILLVDDEPDIIEFLEYNLIHDGFEVIAAHDGIEALQKISQKPDLIILDIMMPKMDGYEVCKKIRADSIFKNTPIIFLTAKSGEMDEVLGLEFGANDFIQKPISPKRLLARVKSNLRKEPLKSDKPNLIIIGPIEIDREKYLVKIEGKQKVFPRKEFEILFYLVKNNGKVISRDILLKNIWGDNVYVGDRTIDVHIRKIREKLNRFSDLIETVKGVGYKFKSVE